MGQIEIVEENRQYLVVNKPSGLPVHETASDEPDLLTLLSEGGPRLHAVNRLDRETSGLVVLAKSPTVAAELMALWNTDAVVKRYLALVDGVLRGPDEGVWQWPLTDRSEGRQNPQGLRPQRKDAATKFRVIERGARRTLVECEILTGRTHQIRRHALLAGAALVGDRRYGRAGAERMGLHSWHLSLRRKGLPREWECPAPADFPSL